MLHVEKYLLVIPQFSLRKALSSLRCSSHQLEVETGRHRHIAYIDRLWVYCQLLGIDAVENEDHFLFCCPLYTDIRYLDC